MGSFSGHGYKREIGQPGKRIIRIKCNRSSKQSMSVLMGRVITLWVGYGEILTQAVSAAWTRVLWVERGEIMWRNTGRAWLDQYTHRETFVFLIIIWDVAKIIFLWSNMSQWLIFWKIPVWGGMFISSQDTPLGKINKVLWFFWNDKTKYMLHKIIYSLYQLWNYWIKLDHWAKFQMIFVLSLFQ